LHDGAAQRARVRVLPARSVLPRTARARGAGRGEAERVGMSSTLRQAWSRLTVRRPHGIAASLLPYTADGAIDWASFEAHVARTRAAGLDVAVNMDTGFGDLLSPVCRDAVVDH